MKVVWGTVEEEAVVRRTGEVGEEGERLGWWQLESGKGEWERKGGEYGQVGGLSRGLGFVRGQTILVRLGQSFLPVQRAQLLRVNQWVVLGHRATSTEGCSVGMKWWRTIMMIALQGNFDLLLHLDWVGTGVDSIDREIALRVIL